MVSDTKGDTTITTFLVTILLQCTVTISDAWKIFGVLFWGIFCTCVNSLYQATYSWPGCKASCGVEIITHCFVLSMKL